MIVQRGRQLPSIIDTDAVGTDGGNFDTDGVVDDVVTLDDSALWIVDKPVLVGNNVELKITEGAQVQFWSSLPDDAYAVFQNAYIQVEGTLNVIGTAARPVRLAPSAIHPTRVVRFKSPQNAGGIIHMQYAHITNISGGTFTTADYNRFDKNTGDNLDWLLMERIPGNSWGRETGFSPVFSGATKGNQIVGYGNVYPYFSEDTNTWGPIELNAGGQPEEFLGRKHGVLLP